MIVGPGDATRVRVIGSPIGELLIEDRAGSKSINKHFQIRAGRRSTQEEREILTEHRDAKVGSFCDWEHHNWDWVRVCVALDCTKEHLQLFI